MGLADLSMMNVYNLVTSCHSFPLALQAFLTLRAAELLCRQVYSFPTTLAQRLYYNVYASKENSRWNTFFISLSEKSQS